MILFSVEFIAADFKLFFPEVVSLAARTAAGALVVMANHERSVMDLLSGAVVVRDSALQAIHVMVSAPVLSVGGNACVVLADKILVPGKYCVDELRGMSKDMKSLDPSGALCDLLKEDLKFLDGVLQHENIP